MRIRWLSAALILCFLTLWAAPASAQGTTSRVTGTVTDSTGAIIPGATVSLTNDQTGINFETTSSGTGTYTFEAVQVGSYTLSVQLQGFKKFVSSGNQVNIGTPTTINAVLAAGGLEESVEVRASSQLVQTSTSGNFGTTFDQRTIESLPILGGRGRNPLDLVLTQPGVVSGANTGGGVHVHGARDRSWNFTLDGIDTNESSAGGSNFSPLRTNPDALAEFKVLTGNQTAEYGRNSGGQVAMITRSGTNSLSGTGFYFDRRPEYNANEWENNIDDLPKRQFTQYMPGFSIGGPLQRNKTFFFVNSQWLTAEQTQSITRTVYTGSARQGIWRYAIGARNRPAGVTGASVDANGNVLPGVNIGTYNVVANDPQGLGLDPETQRLIGLTPLPNNFTTGDGLNTAGFTFVAPEEEEQFDFVTKIDHNFNPQHSTFVRISKGYQNTLCDSVNGGLERFPGTGCIVNTERSPYNWAGNWRWNPGGNVVNEFVVGQNHFTFDFVIPTSDTSRPTIIAPTITDPETFDVGNARTIDTWQIVNNLSWLKGAHSFRLGGNIRMQRHTDIRGSVAGENVGPYVTFSASDNTVDPAVFNLPSNIQAANDRPLLQSNINYLLGRVGRITQGFVQQGDTYAPGGTVFNFEAWFHEFDFYAQDTWKPRGNVTVDAGLRWEAKLAPSNPEDLLLRPDRRIAAGEPPANDIRWTQGKLYDDDWNNIGPSAGVAWDPRDDGKSVVRGNYRMAFDRINTFLLSSAVFQNIPGLTTSVVNTAFGQSGGRLRNGLPSLQPTRTPADFVQPPARSSSLITVVDPEFETPITHAWALSYQREVFRNALFEVAYIGRRAENLFGAYNANQVDIFDNGFLEAFNVVKGGGESALINQLLAPHTDRRAGESGSQMALRVFEDEFELNSVAGLAGILASRIQSGQLLTEQAGLGSFFFLNYPQFLTGMRVVDSTDYSRYHALELKFDRRFSDGYSYLIAYTLSRSKDTRSFDPAFTVYSTGSAQSAASTPFDINNRDLNYALSDFDRTHVFQAQAVYELPFGEGRRFLSNVNRLTDVLLGGWTLSGQLVVQSGRPMTVYAGSNTFTNVVQTPANCDGCSSELGGIHEEVDSTGALVWYFSPDERSNFTIPAPGEFSNTGRNYFRGPGAYNLNMSLAKRTRVVGDQILEFRADATNVLNNPTFGFPTTTFTSETFGRIRNTVISGSRKIMLGVKYYF
jgi:Carboxypeptidase regulatory-like domain/TonB-dependent Receptor Plug Domain